VVISFVLSQSTFKGKHGSFLFHPPIALVSDVRNCIQAETSFYSYLDFRVQTKGKHLLQKSRQEAKPSPQDIARDLQLAKDSKDFYWPGAGLA
jgi:hypothetical protein